MNDESPAVTEVKGGSVSKWFDWLGVDGSRRFATALCLFATACGLYSTGFDLWRHSTEGAGVMALITTVNGVTLYFIQQRHARFEIWKKTKLELHAARMRNAEQLSKANDAMIEQVKQGQVTIGQMFAGKSPTH